MTAIKLDGYSLEKITKEEAEKIFNLERVSICPKDKNPKFNTIPLIGFEVSISEHKNRQCTFVECVEKWAMVIREKSKNVEYYKTIIYR